jgi:hypothetical protein
MAKTGMATLRHAAEDDPMRTENPPIELNPFLHRLYKAGHLRKATRDLAAIGLPEPLRLKMTLTEALRLDRGEEQVVR